MAAPVKRKLIVEVIPAAQRPTSGPAADQAIRALAQIIGRQIAREQFKKWQKNIIQIPRHRTPKREGAIIQADENLLPRLRQRAA